MNIFKKFRAFLRFREAVKLADQAHAKNHHRFYVLPTQDGKLVVTDRKNFRGLRRKGYISRDAKVPELSTHSIYHTGDARGLGGVLPEYLREKFNDYIKYLKKQEK